MIQGREWRHIVDVDGQLVGVDAEVVDAATLLRRAGLPPERPLFLLGRGRAILLGRDHHVRLSEDEVLFFGTTFSPQFQLAA